MTALSLVVGLLLMGSIAYYVMKLKGAGEIFLMFVVCVCLFIWGGNLRKGK